MQRIGWKPLPSSKSFGTLRQDRREFINLKHTGAQKLQQSSLLLATEQRALWSWIILAKDFDALGLRYGDSTDCGTCAAAIGQTGFVLGLRRQTKRVKDPRQACAKVGDSCGRTGQEGCLARQIRHARFQPMPSGSLSTGRQLAATLSTRAGDTEEGEDAEDALAELQFKTASLLAHLNLETTRKVAGRRGGFLDDERLSGLAPGELAPSAQHLHAGHLSGSGGRAGPQAFNDSGRPSGQPMTNA